MSTSDVTMQALKLKPSERHLLSEILQQSLETPDLEIDHIWRGEALSRMKAYDEGKLTTVSMEEVFRDL